MEPGVAWLVAQTQKDQLILEENSIELVSHAAAFILQAIQLKEKRIRVWVQVSGGGLALAPVRHQINQQ